MFVTMTTGRTGARCVARVYPKDRHTRQLCFVGNLLAEIMERPTMQLASLRLSSPYPSANTLKVFESNTTPGALSLFYQSLANRVIHILGETAFLTRQLLQSTASRIGLALLKPLSQTAVTVKNTLAWEPE